MVNLIKVALSLAIGAAVGVITYLSTKGNKDERSEKSSVSNSASSSKYSNCSTANGNEIGQGSDTVGNGKIKSDGKMGLLEFLSDSQRGLERLLLILKNVALSLEYMLRLFANSNSVRGYLPPARAY